MKNVYLLRKGTFSYKTYQNHILQLQNQINLDKLTHNICSFVVMKNFFVEINTVGVKGVGHGYMYFIVILMTLFQDVS